MEGQLFSGPDLAREMDVSPELIRYWVRTKRIVCLRTMGAGRPVFTREMVEKIKLWQASRKSKGAVATV